MLRVAALSAVAVLAFTGAAVAQDYQSGYGASPVYDWSGSYVGLHAGGGWGEADTSFVTAAGANGGADYDVDGGLFGAQLGWAWQQEMMVYGVELGGEWTDIAGDDGGEDGAREKLDTNYKLSAIGRMGVAISNYQPYVLGGLSFIDYDYTLSTRSGSSSETQSGSEVGGTLGGGIEVAVSPVVSLYGEYRHTWFDGDSFAFSGPGPLPGQIISSELDLDTVSAGINLRF